jgi:hypothetical protein
MSTSKKAKAEQRRAKIAEMRAQAERERRRRTLINRSLLAGGAVLVAGGIAAAVVSQSGGDGSAAASPKNSATAMPSTPAATVNGGRTTAPPWPAPGDPSARVAAAGLPMLGTEGSALHIHAHLDVIVDGKAVTVPAELGIDEAKQQISPLHTHDTTGVIHIESPTKTTFTLGQFLTEWDVSVSADHLGGLRAGGGKQLVVYVNGKQQSGDPAALVLHAHDEIALVYGAPGQAGQIPSSYKWTNGL